MVKIVVISDTHNYFPQLPSGNLLIHCGDATGLGSPYEFQRFDDWLSGIKDNYDDIIFCPGNHDIGLEKSPETSKAILKSATVLINESYKYQGINIYASPITPTFFNWAFLKNRGPEIRKEWDKIPLNTDILITHGPPYGILDVNDDGKHCGCEDLLDIVQNKVKPKYHLYGHIHQDRSAQKQIKIGETTYINASVCDEKYRPVNPPIVIEV